MTVGQALRTICVADATWAGLAGSRMYPLEAPQDPQYPLAIYRRISGVPVHAMGADPGLIRERWQVDIMGVTYLETTGLADATAQALSRYRGTVGGIQIQDIFHANSIDRNEGGERIRVVILDFTVWAEEA